MSELQWIASGGGTAPAVMTEPAAPPRKNWAPWAVAGASLAALGAVLLVNSSNSKPQTHGQVRLEFSPPPNTQLLRIDIPTPSPDGRRIMFFGNTPGRKNQLWIRELSSNEALQIAEVQGAFLPFWAPDSRRIGYVGDDKKLWSLNLDGGSPVPVADLGANFGGGSWNQDDVIVFGDAGKLMRVASGGGTPTQIPVSGSLFVYWPAFLPDGKHLVFNATSGHGCLRTSTCWRRAETPATRRRL